MRRAHAPMLLRYAVDAPFAYAVWMTAMARSSPAVRRRSAIKSAARMAMRSPS